MIRSFYGLTRDPFELRDLELLPHQQEIHDTLKVHCQQGGLCLVLGVPGTGKSVIKQALQRLPENQYLIATVARTLHTYTNTVKILCDAFKIDFDTSAFKCERKLIEQAFALNHAGKCLTTILDDAHLMDLANLRRLRLLYEDFPKNHNLILIGRPSLLADLDLGVNQDIKSRVTYSVILKRLNPDQMRDFLGRQLDRAGLGHNTVTQPAVDLIVRSADGVLRGPATLPSALWSRPFAVPTAPSISVLYLALIAFCGKYCRILIRLQDVCYTQKFGKRTTAVELAARGFYPAPR